MAKTLQDLAGDADGQVDALWTAREFARRGGVSVDTVRRWARISFGPRPVRVGLRAVRYRPDEVRQWLAGGGAGLEPQLQSSERGSVGDQLGASRRPAARLLDDAGLTVSMSTTAEALGISHSHACELARRGELGVRVLRLGRRMVVATADLRRVLGLDEEPGGGAA